jgi:hypothetical protein
MASWKCGGLEIIRKRRRDRPIQHGVIHFAVHVERGIDLTQGFPDKVPVINRLVDGCVISLLYDLHHFLMGKACVEKVTLHVPREESKLLGLAAQAQRDGKMLRLYSLVAHIHNTVIDAAGDAGEEHAFETPVGEKEEFLIFCRRVREYVAVDPAQQIRLDLAELATEKMVCLFQGSRRPALGTLELDK